jgi:hypothetical protein
VPDELVELQIRPPSVPEFPSLRTDRATERRLRDDLRRQIALLERRLGELFAAAFPRQGIDFAVASAGGPRVLGVADLERVRDALALRLRDAETEVARRGRIEERNRQRLDAMLEAPQNYRWLRISAREIGEPSCRTWTSEPRLGVIGMLMGWWRVKVSSGCPLASGRGCAAAPALKTRPRPGPLSPQVGPEIAKASPPSPCSSAGAATRRRRTR